MPVQIVPIPMGISTSYLLKDKGTLLIETGDPRRAPTFLKALQKHSIDPEEVKLIIITHGHTDHIGSARAIKEMTGARLAIHAEDKDRLEKGIVRVPPGVTPWGKILSRSMSAFASLIRIEPAEADITLGDEPFPLEEYGIPGKILYTPGHTRGSVTVLLDTGEAFAGDAVFNKFPLTLRPGLPIFAEDISSVKNSLHTLLAQGAQTIFPAHGKPFPADQLRSFCL